MVSRGKLTASFTCPSSNSIALRTSITKSWSSKGISIASSSGSTLMMRSIGSPAFFQASNPPSRKPIFLSNPTRVRRIRLSSSLPGSVTSRISVSKGSNVPAHSANRPSSPIKIESGINPSVNNSAWRVSRMIKSFSSDFHLVNSETDIVFRPFSRSSSRFLYPSLLIFAFIIK